MALHAVDEEHKGPSFTLGKFSRANFSTVFSGERALVQAPFANCWGGPPCCRYLKGP